MLYPVLPSFWWVENYYIHVMLVVVGIGYIGGRSKSL